ncbi:DUF6884 domain-containing protein [Vibrio mediterranei]|uniref:DUF6884 domain-containing protein n=1 Tax=Vibrio mediterranei TaxID=689 RepID=UPI0038CE5E23
MNMTDIEVNKSKPIIIISCSGKKLAGRAKAIDMYCHKNAFATVVRKYLGSNGDHADVFILSGKHGLISGQDEIDPYNEYMPTKAAEREQYIRRHAKHARKLLRSLEYSSRRVFTCLPRNYRMAFDELLGKTFDRPKWQYHASNDKGIGIGKLRGRLTRVCKHILNFQLHSVPLQFCSGVTESHYIKSLSSINASIGTSLHYTNTNKNRVLLEELVAHSAKALRSRVNHIFVDNGFHSAQNQGVEIDASQILHEYSNIYSTLCKTPANTHKISIVIPDSTDVNVANEILSSNRVLVNDLVSKGFRVILPVHSSNDGFEHTMTLLSHFERPELVTIGVPCLASRLYSVGQLERIFEAARANGVTSVHLFGVSQYRRGPVYPERVMLAQLYDITDISADSNRLVAWFGSEHSSRAGSRSVLDTKDKLRSPLTSNFSTYPTSIANIKAEHIKRSYLELLRTNPMLAINIFEKIMPSIFIVDSICERHVERTINALRKHEWLSLAYKFSEELLSCGRLDSTALTMNYAQLRAAAIWSLSR